MMVRMDTETRIRRIEGWSHDHSEDLIRNTLLRSIVRQLERGKRLAYLAFSRYEERVQASSSCINRSRYGSET